jgi:Uma2 family endonuclease
MPTQAPPLENGDQLTRDDFERRSAAMPQLQTAELIDGVVYIPPQRESHRHAAQRADAIAWLGTYAAFTPGTQAGAHAAVRLDEMNETQPVAALIMNPSHGGQIRIDSDDYLNGGPELVAEVVTDSASIDLNKRLRVYGRNDLREYIVWRVQDHVIDWLVQRHGDFERLQTDSAGVYRSQVFAGLWLDAAAMTRGDMAAVLQKLQEGIQSPEHAAFVMKLREEHSKRSS